MDSVEMAILQYHLVVGVAWIVLAVVLLFITLRITRVSKEYSLRRTLFKGIFLLGYIFIITGVLHLVEELLLLLEYPEVVTHTLSLANHTIIIVLIGVTAYSFHQYWSALKAVQKTEG